jgi:hypothetical protein
MADGGPPSTGYKFNTFKEIRSHSSILYNERMAILFYMLDMKSIKLNTFYNVPEILEVRGILKQIYKNVRMLIRNTPTMRATLNLDTKDPGIYVTDVAFGVVDRMIDWCEANGYTTRNVYIIIQELNKLETLIKDILQYFHYFIRPDFRQKPDVETATEKYKEIADQRTIEELRELVGKSHQIDFESLGSTRIEKQQGPEELEYDPEVDGEEAPYADLDDGEDEEVSEE